MMNESCSACVCCHLSWWALRHSVSVCLSTHWAAAVFMKLFCSLPAVLLQICGLKLLVLSNNVPADFQFSWCCRWSLCDGRWIPLKPWESPVNWYANWLCVMVSVWSVQDEPPRQLTPVMLQRSSEQEVVCECVKGKICGSLFNFWSCPFCLLVVAGSVQLPCVLWTLRFCSV